MRTHVTRSIFIVLGMSCGLLYGQTQQVAGIASTYSVTMPSGFTGTNLSTVTLGVGYPTGLSPSSYISGSQLNMDFQGFVSAYPSPTDPPEAILSTVLQNILSKYPQMTGGSLSGEISGPGQTIGGIPIPGPPLGTISAFIGTYNPAAGILGFLDRTGSTDLTKRSTPVKKNPQPASH